MASVIKVETFDVDVTATASQTFTLANAINLNSAFVRRTTSIDKQSGPTTNTGNANPNVACGAAFLSSTTQISFRQNTTTSQKIVGEVWRYTGAAAGLDEFIVRGRYTITLAGGAATGSVAVSGIVDRDRCIPFWTGATNTATSTSDYDGATVSVFIDGSDNIQVERGGTTGTLVIYVTVVEFTGSNWSVGHGRSLAHDTSAETITLNTASTGIGGSTFDVGDWTNAMFIESSLEADTSETGLSDNLGVWSTGSTSQASFTHLQDGASRNDGGAYCHVLVHPGMVVNRANNLNISEGNGTYATNATWPAGSSTTEALDELSLEWFSDTSGTGTAHARGRLSARITAATGTIQYWVHRTGNTVRADWGVVELANVDGTVKLVITDVDTDNSISNSQLNVVATSPGGFEAVQGTGKVELVQNSNYTGTIISQSIDSWSDTSIQFDVAAGALADSFAYIFITTDGGAVASKAVTVGTPPETYQQAQESLSPAFQHYWTFQNTYADEVGTATANNGSGGTPTFSTTPIVRGDTHSLLINGTTEYISAPDQGDMNTSGSASRRMMSGWIMMDRVAQALSVIWEEGAQVNNYAWLIGFGNSLMIQFADDQGDYVQIYFPIKLTPNRPYHVYMEFNALGINGGVCRGLLDGVPNVLSNGNTWEVSTFPSHSGNISWGHEGTENLQVGDSRGVDNVDIAFASPVACHYAHFISMQQAEYTTTQIREQMFEKGAIATVTILGGTEAAMQLSLDAQADVLFADAPCAIEVGVCTAGDFELTLDNITFEDRVSMQIRYMGSDTLTLVAATGTILDDIKLATPYGGTIVVNRPATLTVLGIVINAELRIYDDNGVGGSLGTELDGVESILASSFPYSHNGVANDILIQMIATGFEEILIPFTLSGVDQTLTLNPTTDTNS